eukprot:353426-Chlamydomonas_euryale.AAC.8
MISSHYWGIHPQRRPACTRRISPPGALVPAIFGNTERHIPHGRAAQRGAAPYQPLPSPPASLGRASTARAPLPRRHPLLPRIPRLPAACEEPAEGACHMRVCPDSGSRWASCRHEGTGPTTILCFPQKNRRVHVSPGQGLQGRDSRRACQLFRLVGTGYLLWSATLNQVVAVCPQNLRERGTCAWVAHATMQAARRAWVVVLANNVPVVQVLSPMMG